MPYSLLADLTALLHGAFVAFVVFGGLLAWRWRRVVYVHLPCAAWGAVLSLMGWPCPLTPVENHFRALAGQAGYAGGFVAHYLVPLIYPAGMTRGIQVGLGIAVIAINAAVYAAWRRRPAPAQSR